MVDVRLFGTGERIVFLPYTDTAFEQTQDWMKKHNLFAESDTLIGRYMSKARGPCAAGQDSDPRDAQQRANQLITFDY